MTETFDRLTRPVEFSAGNIWNYRGEFLAKVHAVDIHSVEELCEVTIFAVQEDAGKTRVCSQTWRKTRTVISPEIAHLKLKAARLKTGPTFRV